MTNLQFIKAMKKALADNDNGDKASILNALELVKKFRRKAISGKPPALKKKFVKNLCNTKIRIIFAV